MTALDPVASRLLDRAGVCGPGQGAASARAMTIEQGFPSPDQPDKGGPRLPCRFTMGIVVRTPFVLPSVAAAGSHCATVVGN
jgi:hypothetical protein